MRIGDLGAKFGRNGIDNGWIQFHHVRVPRRAMLARLAGVSRDGVYARAPAAKPQLAYGALIMGRASIVRVSLCDGQWGGRRSGAAEWAAHPSCA